ncbi:MAG: hypothetical protein IJU96_03985 [Clostridia bacterium]|nr:hypothetical protein [Clostridia bacterium]
MKSTKRVLSVLLAAVVLLLLAVPAFAAPGLAPNSDPLITTLAVTGLQGRAIIGASLWAGGVQVSEGFQISSAVIQTDASGKWAAFSGMVTGGVNYRLSLMVEPVDGYYYLNKLNVTVNGSTTDALGNTLTVGKSGNLYVLYYYYNTLPDTSIEIADYAAERAVNYRSTVKLTPQIKNMPTDARVCWAIQWADGAVEYRVGETLRLEKMKSGFTVHARLEQPVDGAWTITAISQSEKVTVRYAWWQWLIRIVLLGFLWY